MPDPLAITPKDTQGKHWNQPANLLPFKQQALIPILGSEAGRLGSSMPLAIHNNQLVAVCGIQSETNLYIDPNGKWLGNLEPQWFSTQPVSLYPVAKRLIPCIDTNSSCLVDPPNGEPIYDEQNQLNPHIQQRIDKLLQTQPHLHKTQQAVTALAQANILMPWPDALVKHHSIGIEGLYTLNERALADLPDADYLALRKAGAIAIGYALSYSLFQLHILQRLVRLNGGGPAPTCSFRETTAQLRSTCRLVKVDTFVDTVQQITYSCLTAMFVFLWRSPWHYNSSRSGVTAQPFACRWR